MRVTAVARRSGGWWAVEVPEAPGVFTQARRLDQVPGMVADALAMMRDVPAESVTVELRPELPDEVHRQVEGVRALTEAAGEMQRTASALSQRLVSELRQGEGLTVRDVGVVLDLSPQRISQIEAAGRSTESRPAADPDERLALWSMVERLSANLASEGEQRRAEVRSRLYDAFARLTRERSAWPRRAEDPETRQRTPST